MYTDHDRWHVPVNNGVRIISKTTVRVCTTRCVWKSRIIWISRLSECPFFKRPMYVRRTLSRTQGWRDCRNCFDRAPYTRDAETRSGHHTLPNTHTASTRREFVFGFIANKWFRNYWRNYVFRFDFPLRSLIANPLLFRAAAIVRYESRGIVNTKRHTMWRIKKEQIVRTKFDGIVRK